MILVDTSVWIEIFRNPPRLALGEVVDLDDVVTCLPVLQEVLQGFADDRAFATAREAMLALPIVESPLGASVFDDAIRLYRTARRTGYTVRSGVDCLIAACALRHGLTVMHFDRDYDILARVSSLMVERAAARRGRPR